MRRYNNTLTSYNQDVELSYNVGFEELISLIENSNKNELEEILKLVNDILVNNKYKDRPRRILNIETETDCEYDVDFDDLTDLILDCSSFEKEEILNMLREDDEDTLIQANNLYDEMRVRVLKSAFDKYSLDELQSRLDIKNNEY